ncbi:MAG: zinc ribbon domain-containing protein [Bacteroides sp.]|nr:zinc ribbon domain-containing protein [Bacteroides sp.]
MTLLVVVFIVSIAAVIFLLIQFKSLAKEETWSDKARKGADDVKFSYTCILSQVVTIIIGCCVIAFTVYSFMKQIKSGSYQSYGINGAFERVSSVTNMVDNYLNTIKGEIVLFSFIYLFFGLLQAIYRIMGWHRIQIGGNDEIQENLSNLVNTGSYSGFGRFCHKCGLELPEGSLFCPGCGTRVPESVVSERIDSERIGEPQITEQNITDLEDGATEQPCAESTGEYDETYEDEENSNRKKWLLWGGIAAGVAIVGVVCTLLFHSNRMEPNANVLANHTVIFKSVEDGVGIDPIEDLEYGTPVECLPSEFDKEGIWIKVAIEKDGKVMSGYMAKGDLINPEDYLLLEKAGLSDSNMGDCIPYNSERLALLYALKRSEGNWKIDILDRYDYRQPNLKILTVRGTNPSEECVGFILSNEDRNGDRTFFLYSTPDLHSPGNPREPVYLYSEPVKEGNSGVSDVKFRKKGKGYDVTYTKATDKNRNGYELTEYPDEAQSNKDPQFGGALEMEGYIDGKYAVKMKITEYPDGSISGHYMYVKNNVPIYLTGQYTQSGGQHEVSLKESVDGNMTGNFTGHYNGLVFSGSWVSADGTKEMPFKLRR